MIVLNDTLYKNRYLNYLFAIFIERNDGLTYKLSEKHVEKNLLVFFVRYVVFRMRYVYHCRKTLPRNIVDLVENNYFCSDKTIYNLLLRTIVFKKCANFESMDTVIYIGDDKIVDAFMCGERRLLKF